MDWLDGHGYEAVTLDQVEDSLVPRRHSAAEAGRALLRRRLPAPVHLRPAGAAQHGWAGVLNLKAEGSDLYPSNVEAMIAAGWELAAHTIHHLDLTNSAPPS